MRAGTRAPRVLAAFIACAALLFAASGAAASGAGEQAAGHLAERQLAQQADGLLGAEQLVDTADVERRGAGFSCPGCSYKSPCCCAAPPKPVTKTLTSTLTVAPRRAAPTTRRRKITTRRIKRRPAVRSETDSLNLEKRQFSDQSDGVDVERRRIGAAAQGRHLCPICPPGNSISAYSPSKIWSGVQFCCPKRKRSTVTVRKTVTKTKRRPGPFNIYATTSKRRSTESPLATHVGLAFEDNDNDGKYNPEIDDPITDQWILIRYGNNTIGRVKTDSNGRYIATSPVYPNVPLKVDLIYSTNVSKPTNTDGNGNSVGFIPIPPPFVNITSFFDKDSNKLYSSGELRAPNITVLIKFANGTVWKTVSTGSKGDLFFNYRHRMPNMPLIIETSDGKFKKQVVMDAAGNLIELVPIPPPKTTVTSSQTLSQTQTKPAQPAATQTSTRTKTATPTPVADIGGYVCLDLARDGTCDPTDPPVTDGPVVLRFPNGSVLATLTTNSTGGFNFHGPAYPNTTFTVEGPPGSPPMTLTTDETGKGFVIVPIPRPVITGSLFWDMDKDGNQTAGDFPEPGAQLVVVLPNGTVYGNVTTFPNGTFRFESNITLPSTELSLVWQKDDGTLTWLKNFTTASNGDGNVDVPLPPALVEGKVWFETVSKNGVQDPNEPPLTNSNVTLLLANGTIWATVPVNSSGYFSYPTLPFPDMPFTVVREPGGPVLGNFSTNGSGNGWAPTPIPPPLITGMVYWDYNNNTSFEPVSDDLAKNRTVDLFVQLANGTNVLYATLVSDSNGNWTYLVPIDQIVPNAPVLAVDRETGATTSFTLDEFGAGRVEIPLQPPPPKIEGQVCWDMNADKNCTLNPDLPVTNETVILLFPNGTKFSEATLLPNGTFDFPNIPRSPNTNFTIVLKNDTIGTLTTDKYGNGKEIIPLEPVVITVRTFLDNDNNKNFTNGDWLWPNETVLLLLPNGTVYANLTMGPNGTALFLPSTPVPGVTLTAVLGSDPTTIISTNITDPRGNGHLDVPIPTGIDGVVFYDSNPNKKLDADEYPYANQTIELRFPNGTIFATVTTSANGSFSVTDKNPGPNQHLFVTTPNGTVLHNFTTNSYGSRHNVEVPIPLGITPGSEITFGNGTTVCSNTPVDVVVGSLLTIGNSSRTIQVSLMPDTLYQSGSVKPPLGWTLEFSTDGGKTWTSNEPVPASTVTNIRASSPGGINAGTIVNDTGNTEQEFTSEAAVASLTSAAVEKGATGGDGWGQIVVPQLDRFFVSWHHNNFVALDCRILSTGEVCPGYDPKTIVGTNDTAASRFLGYFTNQFSSGYFDADETALYLPVTNHLKADGTPQNLTEYPSYGYIGMLCVDVSVAPPALCANRSWYQVGNDLLYMSNNSMVTGLWLGPGNGMAFYNHHKGIWMPSIQKYFMLDAFNWKIQCWDAALKTSCGGEFPYKINGSAALLTYSLSNEPSTKADIVGLGDSSFYVQTDTYLYCFDVVGNSLENCGPKWPIEEYSSAIAGRVGQELGFSMPAFPHEYPIGTVDGVCNYLACFDKSGTVRDDWNASAYMRSLFTWTVARNYQRPVGLYATTLGRSYFHGGYLSNGVNTTVYCWDNILEQPCAGFNFRFPDWYAYTVKVHPANPACLFFTTDGGRMGSFDAYTGAAGCATAVAPETEVTDQGYLTCSGRRAIKRRIKFEVVSVTNGTVGGLKFTALSSLGAPISGYTQLDAGVNSPIDLSGLTLNMTGTSGQYLISMTQPITGQPQVRYRILYAGPGPEMCFTVLPTVNQTMSIPIFAETISKDENNTINAYNTTINATPCA